MAPALCVLPSNFGRLANPPPSLSIVTSDITFPAEHLPRIYPTCLGCEMAFS